MYVEVRSEGDLPLLSNERGRMFNVRRVRCARFEDVRAIRLSANDDRDLVDFFRFKRSIVICRFLVTTGFHYVVTASALVPVYYVIFVGYVAKRASRIRCAVVQDHVLGGGLVHLYFRRYF